LAALLGHPRAKLPAKLRLVQLSPATPAELSPIQPQEQLETAYRLRPDIEVGDRTIRQAEAEVKVAQAELCYPTVSLIGAYEGERTENARFGNDDFGNSVGVQLTYNLFAGGYYRARHSAAKAKVRETMKDLEKTRIGVASEVERVAAQLHSAQEQLVLQQDNTRLVEQNRSLVEKEYKAGVGSLVRLNEAQRDLIAAQVRLAGARVSLRQAYYELQAATGEIVQTFTSR
jgi:outer membrane protein TolC